MDVKDIPQWAWREVDKRFEVPYPATTDGWAQWVDRLRTELAKMIAQHEKPPVDPLLIEAREMAARSCEKLGMAGYAKGVRAGKHDDMESSSVPLALAAIKRGIEIGKEIK